NIGTIVGSTMLKVRLGRNRVLGEVEEYFAQTLTPGDIFVFAGQLLAFLGIRDLFVDVTRAAAQGPPKIPAYEGGSLPLTPHPAEGVRAILADRRRWPRLPESARQWLELQEYRSVLPARDRLLVETFPRGDRFYLVTYAFEGRNAHQT